MSDESADEPLCGKVGRERVDAVIHAFYVKLRADSNLSRFFAHIDDFTEHEQHIALFWWWAMGGRGERTRPFDMKGRHYPLGLNEQAFEQWLAIFHETLLEHLAPELAEAWFALAQGIGANLKRMTLESPPPFLAN
jgi:hemoglobin